MKKILSLAIFLPFVAVTQDLHLSARAGLSAYNGDLKLKQYSLSQSTFFGSLGARYDLTEHIIARTYISLSSLRGDDKKGNGFMKDRNLNFKTRLLEWELGAQYNFFDLNDRWWTPYVYAGAGLFHFNPFTTDAGGNKTFLRPLSTEGQGVVAGVKQYSLLQFCIPLGVGAERSLNENMRVGLEIGYRKLFTDYLDDVSTVYADQAVLFAAKGQTAVDLAYRGDEVDTGPYPAANSTRGSPKSKDSYYYIALTYTFRLVFDTYKNRAGLPAYKREKKVGCPATRY